MSASKATSSSVPTLHVAVETADARARTLEFITSFRIGRADDCAVCVKDEHVSRTHAEVKFENGCWWIRDMRSANGIWAGGERFEAAPIMGAMTIRLGIEGPEVSFEVHAPSRADDHPLDNEAVVARYIEHYFGSGAADQPAGEHTMFVRKAFAQVQTKQKEKFGYIFGALLLCVVLVGVYALYEHQQIRKQRALAEGLFYSMKALDVDIANLERAVLSSDDRQSKGVIRQYETRRKEMEHNYDHFLASLHVYNPKMTDQEKLIMRVARIFGECELDMPPDFTAEVSRYIKLWQSSGRFKRDVETAEEKGYIAPISKQLLDEGLPPQFFYLAMQESDFDPYVNGPVTRKGIAKGMWQFIPETAVKYGMHLGPLVDLRRPDPADDRHHWDKETKAATEYIKDLYATDAQASGLLVMACYNWGEEQVLPLVRSMPANPKERNFWQLLAKHRDKIPRETYDYVFYIVSAAVIGENPRLFGFDFDNPLANLQSRHPEMPTPNNLPYIAMIVDTPSPKSSHQTAAACLGSCLNEGLAPPRENRTNFP